MIKIFITLLAIGQVAFAMQSKRISSAGYTFTLNTTNPKLGVAYMDPSGLIWGEVLANEMGQAKNISHSKAITYCSSLNARLPTEKEYEQLALYLGKDSELGYNPCYSPNGYHGDGLSCKNLGSEDFLSGPSLAYFWTSTDANTNGSVIEFDGTYATFFVGLKEYTHVGYMGGAVRCVQR